MASVGLINVFEVLVRIVRALPGPLSAIGAVGATAMGFFAGRGSIRIAADTVEYWVAFGNSASESLGANPVDWVSSTMAAACDAAQWYGFLNTIAPVQEMIGGAVAILAAMMAMRVYRIIKSWVPTLSGA